MTNSSLPIEEREKEPPSPNPLGIGLPSSEQIASPAGEPSKPSKEKKDAGFKKGPASKAPKRKEASSSSSSSSKEPAKKKIKSGGVAEPQKGKL